MLLNQMRNFFLISFILLSLPLFAKSEPMSIKVYAPEFNIKLPANPTTGFQWTILRYDARLLKLKQSKYLAPKVNLMGAGGVSLFTFIKKKDESYPNETEIVFKYSRSWEPQSGYTKIVKVYFKP